MEPKDYTVVKIEGEYAYLRADGDGEGDDLFIALALLPPGVDAGTRLHYEIDDWWGGGKTSFPTGNAQVGAINLPKEVLCLHRQYQLWHSEF